MDSDLSSYVGIMDIEVGSLGLSEYALVGLLLKVDVSVETRDGFGLIGGLGEARGSSEWVGSDGSRHVEVLSIGICGPVSDWLLLRVVALWDLPVELLIWLLLTASPGALLNNKLLITVIEAHIDPVLCLHDLSAYCILLVIFRAVCCTSGGLPSSLLSLKVLGMLCFLHFLFNLLHYL